MVWRDSPGRLTETMVREMRLPSLVMETAKSVVVLLATLLMVVLADASVTTRPTAGMEGLTQQVRLPVVMRNAPAAGDCAQPCAIMVRVKDEGGGPVEGARILGLYGVGEGQATSVNLVTDENGEAILPGFDGQIIVEVQLPVGLFPCPGSPPRVRLSPGDTTITFIGCRV